MRFVPLLCFFFFLLASVSALSPRLEVLRNLKPVADIKDNLRLRAFWGAYGHAAIASIAQTLITPAAFSALQTLLPETGGLMAPIASWADEIREQPGYTWSKGLHFINTQAWVCTYERKRDCVDPVYGPLHCVDGAIQNYTARTLNSGLGAFQQNEAIKFLIHFVGDVHQPLHCGFIQDYGGNDITGNYYGNYANLHEIWDTKMIETRVDNNYGGSNATWVQALIQNVANMPQSTLNEWRACSLTDPNQACSDQWGMESVKLACAYSYVEVDGTTHIADGFNISTPYYQRNLPIVESQIMKGGVRLANVLNSMFASKDELAQF